MQEEHCRRTDVALHLLRLKLSTESLREFEQNIGNADLFRQARDQDNQGVLIVTSNELNQTTRQFSQYFIADYRKLMRSVSEIAAYLVIYSGPSAKPRLEQLTEAGFKGMGSFTELSFHKVILLLMSVFIGAFVLFYGHFSMVVEMSPGRALSLTTKIATVYAFSALCGALIGSSRRLMQKDELVWAMVTVPGLWITFMVHHGLETGFGKFRLVTDEDLNLDIVLASSALSFVFAFVIGASAIAMARRVAHSGLAVEPGKMD